MNVLQWRAVGMNRHHAAHSPILIRKIEITGVAYTSECSKCRAGSYSSGGTEFCALCGANSFSGRGASQCQPCSTNEYSEMGSSKCTTKPACTHRDYYEYQTQCDENKQTRKMYGWIEPKTCNENAAGSVSLPAQSEPEQCPPCNPGMAPLNVTHCTFCPADQYSDGSSPCQACAASTSPQYALDYRWWTVMPENVSSDCLSMASSKCSPQAGWLLAQDHIRTHYSHDKEVFLILTMKIPGFRGASRVVNGKADIVGSVSFTFDINCTVGDCELVFLSDEHGKNSIAKSWKGSHTKTNFVYNVRSNKSVIVTWAFQPYDWETMPEAKPEDYINNVARIHSIKVANSLGGGATECKPCPRGRTKDSCIPCPDGQYIDDTTSSCKSCPPNTVVSTSDSWGLQACKPCGSGLKAEDGKVCKSDCRFRNGKGKEFDFSQLDKLQFIVGNKLFTSSGTQYYHGFNVSLCGAKSSVLPTCANNVTDGMSYGLPSQVSGMICRSTLVPQRDQPNPVSTQPVSLGDHLTKIESNVANMSQLYEEEGFTASPQDVENDIHFYYKSEQSTPACPEGRTTIISMRCDVKQDLQGAIDLPPKCSDGTCDGCTFHFLWRSQHACPICREEDYEVIKGECIGGEQTIHYYPPKHCILLDTQKPKQMKQKCTTMSFAVQVALPIVIGVGLLLMILLIYLWKRNKRLEYKYMKLVETAGGRDGELPGVESCGVDDEEDDEDAVHFPDKGPSIFQKLKNKITSGSSKDDDNPFIAVKMQEKLPLT